MEQLKAFLEKARTDEELSKKIETLSENSEEAYNEAIIALAAGYGFTIDTDEIKEINLPAQYNEISEEQLEAISGGGSKNRYCPDWCRGLTERRTACTFPFVHCDHYRDEKIGEDRFYKYYNISCVMGAFPTYRQDVKISNNH